MQLRGPLVGPDRWWYHTLLKETVRDTLASYGSVPESGPYLFFDQRSSNQPETHSVVPGCVVPRSPLLNVGFDSTPSFTVEIL